tara:strand:+ start:69 stop:305 length:237 start_codon:yes stop_codon:yes gene_type:complete
MSQIIDTKLASYKEELSNATERLGQIQNAERQTTQQIIALKGAIEALEETNKEMLSTAGQEAEAAGCEMPQPGTVELG